MKAETVFSRSAVENTNFQLLHQGSLLEALVDNLVDSGDGGDLYIMELTSVLHHCFHSYS